MGRRKGVPPIKSEGWGDSTQNRWIVLGIPGWRPSMSPEHTLHPSALYFFAGGSYRCHQTSFSNPLSICSHPYDFVQPSTSYELLPESVTGVIESALSWFSDQHWWCEVEWALGFVQGEVGGRFIISDSWGHQEPLKAQPPYTLLWSVNYNLVNLAHLNHCAISCLVKLKWNISFYFY